MLSLNIFYSVNSFVYFLNRCFYFNVLIMDQLLTKLNAIDDPLMPPWAKLLISLQFIITEITCVQVLSTRVNELESFKAVNEQVTPELKTENKRLQVRLGNLPDVVDDHEHRNINICLLLHGVEEMDGENTDDMVLKIINERLELPMVLENIQRSHRLGPRNASRNTRQNPTKPRAIIFRFRDLRARQSVFYKKKMLQGTGISITENLTKNGTPFTNMQSPNMA